VTDDLAVKPFPNEPADYFSAIGKRLFQELAYSLSDPDVSETHLLLLDMATEHRFGRTHFSNTGTHFYPPELIRMTYSPRQFMVFAGSTIVYGDMQIAGKLSQPTCLQEAVNMVHEYAKTCVESNASVEDCSSLGGHVHVASIKKDGFSWVVERLNIRSKRIM